MVGTPGVNFGDLLFTAQADIFSTSLMTVAEQTRFKYLYFLGGNDVITVDTVYQPSVISGGFGNDMVSFVTVPQANYNGAWVAGGGGNDTIFGSKGDDLISGNAGWDRLHGGLGADRITGGPGNDSMWGGFGSDTFVYNAGESVEVPGGGFTVTGAMGSDVIWDFQAKGFNADHISFGVPGLTFADVHLTAESGGVRVEAQKANVEVYFDGVYHVNFSMSVLLAHVALADISAADFTF